MSIAAAHLWHKPSERAAWMRRFVIVSDSAIRIYGTRNDHEQHAEPMYYIELLTTTDLLNGSDNIVYQGWLEKKGKIRYNSRWCALVKYGYLNYIDPEQKQGIRSIDISNVELILEKSHNIIQWKNDKGEWFQFRCDSPSIQSRWHTEMLSVQNNFKKTRKETDTNDSLNKEPTLFAFIVRKPINFDQINSINDIKSNRYEQHYFCADNDQYLEGWKKCIIEQIAHCNDETNKSNQQSKFLRNKLAENRKRSYNNSDTLRESVYSYQNNKTRQTHSKSNVGSSDDYIARSRQISVDWIDYENISDINLNNRMEELMNDLKIPKHARKNMLALNKKQKIKMLEQHHIKRQLKTQHESGRIWSNKFANYSPETNKNVSTLQQFSVVLRDETDEFLKEFIQNLGLDRLCRLATESLHSNGSSLQRGKSYFSTFDMELLRVIKAIIDANEYSIKCIVEHNLCIRIIVDKIDSADIKISELALSLLVTMVGIENDEISIAASNKILSGLTDLALSKGQRNKYKVLISHMSIKDILNGSFQYDTYTITLINYLIMCLVDLHKRMDERRLLNSLQFDKMLHKLEDRTRNFNNNKYKLTYFNNNEYNDALINQIETYRKLYETDKRNANTIGENDERFSEWDMMNDFDIDNPKDLFKRLHDQCLNDGYINELTSILKNLIVLPSHASGVWYNVSKIINHACKPMQYQMLYPDGNIPIQQQKNDNNDNDFDSIHSNTVIGGTIQTKNFDEHYVPQPMDIISTYPTYKQLKTMLEIREATNLNINNGNNGNNNNGNNNKLLQNELNESREKQLQLEDALFSEKSKNLNLESQLQHLLKYGTSQISHPMIKTNSNTSYNSEISNPSSQSSQTSFIVIEEENDDQKKYVDGEQLQILKVKKTNPPPININITIKQSQNDELNKYRKMIKFKMPKNSIINRMRQDGVNKNIIQQYVDMNSLPGGNNIPIISNSNGSSVQNTNGNDTKTAAKNPKNNSNSNSNKNISANDEKMLVKYKKMLKINIPKQSVINRMRQDKIPIRVIGLLFPDAVEAKNSNGNNGILGGKSNILSALKRKKAIKPKLPPGLKPKKIIKPKNKMRNLHWTTVNPYDINKTIWNNIDDAKIEFDINDLESKFCWKQIKNDDELLLKNGRNTRNKPKPKNDIVRVLDTRRAYNIEIFLGRLKMDPWTLRQDILSLNENKLNLDTVHKLINFVPTKEESSQLDGYENEKNLGVAENFVKIIRTVDTDLIERLTLWEFKMEFNDLYVREQEQLIWLRKGHDSIKKSKHLQIIFSIILSFGNYMNGSTAKGQAYGFKLGSLTQLMRSRTVDNSATLMEYLYEFINTNDIYKNSINFLNDLSCLDEACCVDISILRQNIAQIGNKLRRIKKRIDSFNDKQLITRMGDNFYKMIKPFYISSILQFNKLEKLRDEMFNDLKGLGIWLNEAKDSNFKYLKTLNEFRLNFTKTIKLYKIKKQKQKEIEKRKKWKENKSKNKKKYKSKQTTIVITKKKKNVSNVSNNNNNIQTNDSKNNELIENKIIIENKNNEEEENKLYISNRESIIKRRQENKHLLGVNELRHNDRDKNISDVVIQTLVEGSSYNFIQRLQNRNKNASKNKYCNSPSSIKKKPDLI